MKQEIQEKQNKRKPGSTRVKDMTTGNPLQLILAFAIPIFIGNLFQQFYNVVDTMIAGHFLGDQALAAVGATASIYSLIVGMANGMNNGYAIIVANAFGAGELEKLKRSVAMMLLLNISAAVLFTGASAVLIKPVLIALHTPADIFADAFSYLFVILMGMTATIFYNMEAGLLRALGNSKTPLYFLIFASFTNVGMDLLFILTFGLGIKGAALATVISQLLSVILCFVHILRHYPEVTLQRGHFIWDRGLLTEMFPTGLSMGLMGSIVSVGSVVLQSAINGLGTAVITAHTAARRIIEICMQPLSSLSTANATFVGQNYGARNMKRIQTGIRVSCLTSFVWSTIALAGVYTLAPYLIHWLTGTTDGQVLQNAVMNLQINMPFYYFLGVLLILRTSLQGIGRRIIPLISSSLELLIKCLATWFLVPRFAYVGASIAEPSTWLVCMVFLLIIVVWKRQELFGSAV